MRGQRIDGRYEILERIGAGGVGEVYRARQHDLGREVAIKVLRPEVAQDAHERARLVREARAASALGHPGAVTIYGIGEWEDRPYIVMELLRGRPLSAVELPLAPDRIVRLLTQVCDVLQAAHEAGLVHRDLKPDNVMLLDEGPEEDTVRVVDFGLAFFTSTPTADRITADNSVAGTPAYMSPEQCRGAALDSASDVYSLGVVLYELLCGQVPFEAQTFVDAAMQVMLAVPVPPSARTSSPVSAPLERLALDALSKRKRKRPTVAQFAKRLRKAASASAAAGQHRVLAARRRADGDPIEGGVVVVEALSGGRDSLSGWLQSVGFDASAVPSVSDVAALETRAEADAVVVDMRAGEAVFQSAASAGWSVPVVAVIADDDFSLLREALTAGFSDVVPQGQVPDRLGKAVRRALRLSRR